MTWVYFRHAARVRLSLDAARASVFYDRDMLNIFLDDL